MDNHGGMISTGENSWFIHQSYLAVLSADIQKTAGGSGEGYNEFCLTTYLLQVY
jgi:hypothetical protein